jgi:hypothetical protein
MNMGRLRNGILGGINGKIGDAEGYIRNGIAYVRAKRRKSNKPPTEKQLAGRQKMALVNRFINTMTAFVGAGFELVAKGQAFSANNAAKSYQLKYALEGEYPDLAVNYSKVKLSSGKLQPAEGAAVKVLVNGLKFTWECQAIAERVYYQSTAMLLVHCPALNLSFYDLSGLKRIAGEQLIELPLDFNGHSLHCYISFVTDDRKMIADSVYVGEVGY